MTTYNIETVLTNLKKNHFEPYYFATKQEAIDFLTSQINGKSVGLGDSQTLWDLQVYDVLRKTNDITDPQHKLPNESFKHAAKRTLLRDVFITSVNALATTGEMVNIDGSGNRVAGSLFGSDEVYFVLGTNKITPDLVSAIDRARHVAAPLNGIRKAGKTPCAIKQDGQCYDCSSPDRICNALTVYYKKMRNVNRMVVIIINEELGF